MVLAYHLVFTTYGFWLTNDPRGSWSDFVRCWEIFWHGPATKVTTRASLARREHDRQLRRVQTSALKYEPVRFSGAQLRGVALGFARAIAESGYLVFACSILPEHIHLVVQRHANPGERIIGHLKGRATQELIAGGIHPFGEYANADGEVPCMWARRGWRVYLHTVEEILRAIRYVEGNPLKQGMPRQEHSFVTPYAARFDGIDPAGLVV